MQIKVLAFGIAKEIFGSNGIILDIEGEVTIYHIRETLEAQYPRLKQLANYMVAVNNEYANNEVLVNAMDEIAIIPPVSGG